MNQEAQKAPRATEIIKTFAGFKEVFEAGERTVKDWEKKGAPIIRNGRGVPMCEKWEMWCWLKKDTTQTSGKKSLAM
ncbi:hypothetical protein [Maridesulfovibrio ferrireducens]|uniref:hypothetical protein n=1 Tax=Maridesulfovibrio ferrireducens TaxID=246191 RepID=UPI001A30AE04|nr:hypothetical protein [Maridesulfovibrio ferrireducens]MBI9113280.1 hypothetical protein [Maridesulfovibrio ferrireducens]